MVTLPLSHWVTQLSLALVNNFAEPVNPHPTPLLHARLILTLLLPPGGIVLPMTATYPTPAHPIEIETEVKKSRFIARAAKVTNRQEAMAYVAQARQDYPDARHHCWAYLLGNPVSASTAAHNDDGEPSGTAGKPILNVLQHKGVGDVVLVVIRYFGGIKLGAGGLVRAYSGAAEAAMSQLTVVQAIAMQELLLHVDFAREQLVRHWLEQHQGEILSVDYGDQVTLEIRHPEANLDALREFCAAQGLAPS